MSKNKVASTKSIVNQKKKRRQWITFLRMIRYGINNFSRNAWLTIAATAVMTITLLVILATLASRQILTDTISQIREKVDMSIYLESDTTDDQAKKIVDDIRKLESVTSVNYINPDQIREDYVEENKNNPRIIKALNESIAEFPGAVRINVKDINDISELQNFVNTNDNLKKYIDETREPSFAGPMRVAIENVGRTIGFAEKLGMVVSVLFVVISSLIVFNTIRMAIFNRKEEIKMMKLIGAEKSFIRGPFVIEAVVYGFIAAIIATGISVFIFINIDDKLNDYGVAVSGVSNMLSVYFPLILICMMLVGAIIGIISSLLATRKYLKI